MSKFSQTYLDRKNELEMNHIMLGDRHLRIYLPRALVSLMVSSQLQVNAHDASS